MGIDAGTLDRKVRFQRKAGGDDPMDAGEEGWVLVAELSAQVQDMLPSRGERLSEGMTMSTRPARVRLRYRPEITSDLRLLVGKMVEGPDGEPVWRTDRVMQIVAGPVELGRRAGMELMAADYSPVGGIEEA